MLSSPSELWCGLISFECWRSFVCRYTNKKMYCFPVLQPSLVASTSCFQCKSHICQLATLFKVLHASTSSGSLLWRLKQLVASTIPQQLAALRWQCGWTMEVDYTNRATLSHPARWTTCTTATLALAWQHCQRVEARSRQTACNRHWCQQSTVDVTSSSQEQVAHYLQPSLMPTINNHMVGGRIKRRWWSTQSLANTASLPCFCQHTTPSPKCKL